MDPVLRPEDDTLGPLESCTIASELLPGVTYRLGQRIGAGRSSVAFLATRRSPGGAAWVVVKIVRPTCLGRLGAEGALMVRKEAVALGRLNERVPPATFVVRLLDTGSLRVSWYGHTLDLPWLVLEHVNGGAEGTTLADRVARCIRETGFAFDAARAAHAVEHVASGLGAVHDVGVVHRDVRPENILCCGSGPDEVFKVSDFGLARPAGVRHTFASIEIATPGYGAPELVGDSAAIGPPTDVFGFASVVWFLLTGERYIEAMSPMDTVRMAAAPTRPSLWGSARLSPELRRHSTCRALDDVLRRATALDPRDRPSTAAAFAAEVLPWLGPRGTGRSRSFIRRSGFYGRAAPEGRVRTGSPSWTTLHHPLVDVVVRDVAWDGDGTCLAATRDGLLHWDGMRWREVSVAPGADRRGIRFVRRIGAGRFIVGGDGAKLLSYAPEGVAEIRHDLDDAVTLHLLSGDLEDLAVLAGSSPHGAPVLHAVAGLRRMKPLALEGAASITGLARITDTRWMVTGRWQAGGGFVAIHEPLQFAVGALDVPKTRAFLACAGRPEAALGLAVGADGAAMWFDDGRITREQVPGGYDLSAAAIDPLGRGWAAAAGHVFLRTHDTESIAWTPVWEDAGGSAPIVSLFADSGVVRAVTADAAVVEGRLPVDAT